MLSKSQTLKKHLKTSLLLESVNSVDRV